MWISQGLAVTTQQIWDLKLGLIDALPNPSFFFFFFKQRQEKTSQDAYAKPEAKEQGIQHLLLNEASLQKLQGAIT